MKVETNSKIVRNRFLDNTYDNRERFYCSESDKRGIEGGIYTGFARGYNRYGLLFTEAIGVRVSPDGSTLPLFYGEVKIDADNQYHPLPRTRPSEE